MIGKIVAGLVAAACLCGPAFAGGECHFKPAAILCIDGQDAGMAYGKYGMKSGHGPVQPEGCVRAREKYPAAATVKQISHGAILFQSGWVSVSAVDANGKDMWYVASNYLGGVCEAFVPQTITVPQKRPGR